MGISIHIMVSKSTTKEEWKAVYEESLKLVRAFPLAEKRKVNIQGINTVCLVPTRERKKNYGWHNDKNRVGWDAVGDYRWMRTAEDYYLPRDLVTEDDYEETVTDAMLGVLPVCMDRYNWEDPRCQHVYELWGDKTQGEPYHMYLLAIACMIECRLGHKAFVYGDITGGQCRRAVQLANKYLENPVKIPDRCDMERFIKRVAGLPLSEWEQLSVFEHFYMGTKNAGFGEFIRKTYPEAVCDEYWKIQFDQTAVETIGFDEEFGNYMLWGFDLGKLCHLVCFEDKNGASDYEKFVKRVMDAKLHLKEKNCEDALKIDPEETRPYSVATQFAQLFFAPAKNKKVDRYIPIEEIKTALVNNIGDKCEVIQIIDEYLENEQKQLEIKMSSDGNAEKQAEMIQQDPSEMFNQQMNKLCEAQQKKYMKYDIAEMEDLNRYEAGDTMPEHMKECLGKSFAFYNSLLEERYYTELMEDTSQRRCEWLIEQNRSILIRDKDWEKIFSDIKENKESFARYYPMVRVRITSDGIYHMIVSMILNDDLYEYCKELGAIYGETNV